MAGNLFCDTDTRSTAYVVSFPLSRASVELQLWSYKFWYGHALLLSTSTARLILFIDLDAFKNYHELSISIRRYDSSGY